MKLIFGAIMALILMIGFDAQAIPVDPGISAIDSSYLITQYHADTLDAADTAQEAALTASTRPGELFSKEKANVDIGAGSGDYPVWGRGFPDYGVIRV